MARARTEALLQSQSPKGPDRILNRLIGFGFRLGRGGAHQSRTMMLDEIQTLLDKAPVNATKADYRGLIVDANLLGKGTFKARQLTAKHLVELYGLDDGLCLFRVLRDLWQLDLQARPVLALTLALARDPLLRLSSPLLLAKQPGETMYRREVEELFEQAEPARFSAVSLQALANHINGSWTQAGFLQGRVGKVRCAPTVTPTNLAYAFFVGHLEGLRAQRLFSSDWARLMSGSQDQLVAMAQTASRRGLMVFMNAGGVMEARFPGYLTPEEEGWLHE